MIGMGSLYTRRQLPDSWRGSQPIAKASGSYPKMRLNMKTVVLSDKTLPPRKTPTGVTSDDIWAVRRCHAILSLARLALMRLAGLQSNLGVEIDIAGVFSELRYSVGKVLPLFAKHNRDESPIYDFIESADPVETAAIVWPNLTADQRAERGGEPAFDQQKFNAARRALQVLADRVERLDRNDIETFTVQQAAGELRCDEATVSRRCNKGRFPGQYKDDAGKWRIPESLVRKMKKLKEQSRNLGTPVKTPAQSAPAPMQDWDCPACSNSVKSHSRPPKCPKCATGFMSKHCRLSHGHNLRFAFSCKRMHRQS